MSVTIMANPINGGVRRLSTLGAMGWLGSALDIMTSMGADGYDLATLGELFRAGASEAMLQDLWDNTAAGSPEFAIAANRLLTNLTHGPGGAASAPDYPQGAIPQISTAFGSFDLSLRSEWDKVTTLFNQMGSGLNAIAARNPNDPTVIQMRGQYNSLANQFSSAWSTVFSSASPIHTLGTWEDVAAVSGIVILGGIAIASGVGIPLVAVVGTVLAGLYVISKWINSQNAQTAVAQTAANTGAGLSPAYNQQVSAANAAYASGNKALGDSLMAQANATLQAIQNLSAPGTGAPTDWSKWLQSNLVLILAALGAIVIVPPLLRKR